MQIEAQIIFFIVLVSPGKCRRSAVEVPWKCHGSAVEVPNEGKQPTATDLPLLAPPLSTVGWSKTVRFNNLGKKWTTLFLKTLSSQSNFRNSFFDQRSPRHPDVGILQSHKQTDGHRNYITKLAQWAYSVKIPHTGDIEPLNVCHMSYVTGHMSHVICHISTVT